MCTRREQLQWQWSYQACFILSSFVLTFIVFMVLLWQKKTQRLAGKLPLMFSDIALIKVSLEFYPSSGVRQAKGVSLPLCVWLVCSLWVFKYFLCLSLLFLIQSQNFTKQWVILILSPDYIDNLSNKAVIGNTVTNTWLLWHFWKNSLPHSLYHLSQSIKNDKQFNI